jgi:hypothetical protein
MPHLTKKEMKWMKDVDNLHYQVQIHLLLNKTAYPRIRSHRKEVTIIRMQMLLTNQVLLFLSMVKTIEVILEIPIRFFSRKLIKVQTKVSHNPIPSSVLVKQSCKS